MKRIVSIFSSMFFTGLLVVIFAIAIAYATFIENDYGTITAKILIYNAKWFEILLLLLCINLISSVFANKLISKKRWAGVILHFSFVIVFIGSALTRYYGYEGTMHIREGSWSNTIVSEPTYIKIKAKKGGQEVIKEKQVMFSPYTANRFSETVEIDGQEITIKNAGYVPSAEEVLTVDPNGSPIISVMAVANESTRSDFLLHPGDLNFIENISFGFDVAQNNSVINFKLVNGKLFAKAADSIAIIEMMGKDPVVVAPQTEFELNTQNAYSIGNVSFAIKQFLSKGVSKLNYAGTQNRGSFLDAFQAEVSVGNSKKMVNVFGAKGAVGNDYNTNIDGMNISLSYGSKIIELPFSLYLKDFQLERYPGSNSPSSFASEVVLQSDNIEKPFRIYMNNILKYDGFRFFQSSYDPDEKGTILSVNNDALGTTVTYIGYLLMAIGMVWVFFNKNSRIKALITASAKLRLERQKLFMILVIGLFFGFNTNVHGQNLNKEHVSEFSEIIVVGSKERIEPVNTLASEILRKVAGKNKWEGLSPTEVFLEMHTNPEKWKNIPIIKVGNSDLRKMLNTSGNYVSFNGLFNPANGSYKLNQLVDNAYGKNANQRNKYDKEVINVDERANILMQVFMGDFLKIFPVPNDENSKWVSVRDAQLLGKEGEAFANSTLRNYFSSIQKNDWATANSLLNQLKSYQQKIGADVIPAQAKIKSEVLYNNMNIFSKLSKIYMLLGLIMLGMSLSTVFNPAVKLTILKKSSLIIVYLLFAAHTFGLGLRWYISGHAPWSNGYESMVFVSWATCLAGLIFANRSEITLSMTTLLAGLTLMVAGFSWMSPEITNLVPVLKSYWLIVHVAIIVSSYGFLGVGALLGMLNLILMIFRNKNNSARVDLTIKELINIIDISLIIGLIMVTLGSFLGGVWANESWGRYWGWDPKETWALVTILVYTFITHMHKIPGFKGSYAKSAASLIGFSSVLMTYFGVNYYLSGLHSYAQGEPAPVPMGVYVAAVLVFMLIFASYFAYRTVKEKNIE
jgi:cytochrome c-type biogenesis protein CcsB